MARETPKSPKATSPPSEDSPQETEESEEAEQAEQLLPNTTIVTHCIYKNDPHRFLRCFEDETDPYKDEIQELLNERDSDGKSPLDLAACLGRVELTKEMIKHGAEINACTLKGYTCLHYAAAWGRLPVLKILVENGGDFEKRNAHGERPREAAERYEQTQCVDFLDWAEARHRMREEIRKTLEAFQEIDKAAAGRISKDEKTMVINACKEKQEWLDNTADPTTEEFISHFTMLHEIAIPVMQKLSEPPPAKESTVRPRSKTRPTSSRRPPSGSRPKTGKKSGGPVFNPQKGKKKGK